MPTLADRLTRLEQRTDPVTFDDHIKATRALTQCAAYKIGAAIAELAGMPWDVESPEGPSERAASAVRGNDSDVEEARNKLQHQMRRLSIPMLFFQCRQVHTGDALASEVVAALMEGGSLARLAPSNNVREPMDEGTADSFLALLTHAEIVALGWCWAFYARPEQMLPR